MIKPYLRLACLPLLAFSPLAFAHPGHGLESAAAGFLHPLTGGDHLLVMLAVGWWAGRIGGTARWQLPLTFMAVMAFGAGLGLAGWVMPAQETGIAVSVLAMGLLLSVQLPLRRALQLGLVSGFALLHGLAHGAELGNLSAWRVMAGMLLATALLHGLGLLLGSRKLALPALSQRLFGLGMAAAGAYLMLA